MKKDYVVVEDRGEPDELAFVEEFWTQRWDQQSSPPSPESVAHRPEMELMLPYLKSLPPGSRLLDGGCGLGEWTVFLARQGFEVVGLDISARTIARLQQLFPRQQFVRGDLRATEFAGASFDAYFSWGTFEHFENGPGECIAEAHRLLKPGGWLFVSVPYQNWRHILREARSRYRWQEGFNLKPGPLPRLRFYQWRFTKADLRQELEMRGFEVLKLKPLHRQEGVRRALVWDLKLTPETRLFHAGEILLLRLLPGGFIAHMLMAVARKIEAAP
ncbi:MAG: class I SAM-dependent methyltransferase [Thermodesulfobacteriota bacterium]